MRKKIRGAGICVVCGVTLFDSRNSACRLHYRTQRKAEYATSGTPKARIARLEKQLPKARVESARAVARRYFENCAKESLAPSGTPQSIYLEALEIESSEMWAGEKAPLLPPPERNSDIYFSRDYSKMLQ